MESLPRGRSWRKKGATPARAKLAQRGSGALIHLCTKSGCQKPPLQAKGIAWLHFSSWRPVKKEETEKGWMQTAATDKWRKADVETLKIKKLKTEEKQKKTERESEEEEDASEDESDNEEEDREPAKKKPRSSLVMERLAEKIQTLEDDAKKKEPKKKKRKTEEDSEEEDAKAEKTKVTVEELKARLKAVRDSQKQKS